MVLKSNKLCSYSKNTENILLKQKLGLFPSRFSLGSSWYYIIWFLLYKYRHHSIHNSTFLLNNLVSSLLWNWRIIGAYSLISYLIVKGSVSYSLSLPSYVYVQRNSWLPFPIQNLELLWIRLTNKYLVA